MVFVLSKPKVGDPVTLLSLNDGPKPKLTTDQLYYVVLAFGTSKKVGPRVSTGYPLHVFTRSHFIDHEILRGCFTTCSGLILIIDTSISKSVV